MKKLILGLVFVLTIMGCENVINIPTEVPEYKPEDGVTFIGMWRGTNGVWEFIFVDSSTFYINKYNTGLKFSGKYKLSNQDSYQDGMVGEVKTGTFTYSGKSQWSRYSNLVVTYRLTTNYVEFHCDDPIDSNWLIGTGRYNRVN